MKRIRSGSRYKPIFGTVVALSVLITLFSMSRSLYAQQGRLHSETGALNAPDKEAREAAAEFIVAREEAAAGRAFDPGYRAKVLKKLASQTSSQLESIQSQSDAGLGILAYGSSGVDLAYPGHSLPDHRHTLERWPHYSGNKPKLRRRRPLRGSLWPGGRGSRQPNLSEPDELWRPSGVSVPPGGSACQRPELYCQCDRRQWHHAHDLQPRGEFVCL